MTKTKYLLSLIILAMLSIIPSNAIEYKSFIDPSYGFYKMRDVTTFKEAPYDVATKTLTINQGDTVTWMNDGEDRNTIISIVSDQNLWSGAAKTPTSYTFNVPGQYSFYIKEYSSFRHLTVIVGNGSSPNNPNIIPTPVRTYASPKPTDTSPIIGDPNNTIITTPEPTTIVQQPIAKNLTGQRTPLPPSTPMPTQPPVPAITTTYPTENISRPVVYTPVIPFPESAPQSFPINATGVASIVVGLLAIIITRKVGKS